MQHMDPGESQQEKGLEELWPWKSLPRLKTRSKKSTHTHLLGRLQIYGTERNEPT